MSNSIENIIEISIETQVGNLIVADVTELVEHHQCTSHYGDRQVTEKWTERTILGVHTLYLDYGGPHKTRYVKRDDLTDWFELMDEILLAKVEREGYKEYAS